MKNLNRPIIVIAGPTCSGKSSIALQLAKDIDGVIINGDSRQIYTELRIGTARPTQEEMQGIPHYLYGHISVREDYNIFKYQKDFNRTIQKIPNEKAIILVGGTGLYIDSVIFNYKLKENNEKGLDIESKDIEEIRKLIPKSILENLNESDRNNPRRLLRILQKGTREAEKGNPLLHKYFVIDIEPNVLRERIAKRVDNMFKEGLVEENHRLQIECLTEYKALSTIGYQEFRGYFDGTKKLEEVKQEIINHTNQYAKRQRTWFRRNPNAIWSNNYPFILEESLKLNSMV